MAQLEIIPPKEFVNNIYSGMGKLIINEGGTKIVDEPHPLHFSSNGLIIDVSRLSWLQNPRIDLVMIQGSGVFNCCGKERSHIVHFCAWPNGLLSKENFRWLYGGVMLDSDYNPYQGKFYSDGEGVGIEMKGQNHSHLPKTSLTEVALGRCFSMIRNIARECEKYAPIPQQ